MNILNKCHLSFLNRDVRLFNKWGKKLKFIFYECYFSFIDFKKDINALKIRNVVDIHMYIS